jgi:hypothetical protein
MATLNLIKGHNLALKPADAQAERTPKPRNT